MEYLTAYHWQEKGGGSLLLQQYWCRRTPVCFACLCSGRGDEGRVRCRDAAEGLWEWCRAVPWQKAARRPDVWIGRLERELEEVSEEWEADGRVRLTLLLGIGPEILALGGGHSLCLLNTSFGRGRADWLPGEFCGLLEPGAGLLLATDGFLENLERERLGEALRLSEIRTQSQAERRLRELAAASGRADAEGAAGFQACGGEAGAAILLIGREDGCVY